MARDVLEWEAPEYERSEKTSDWFWAVGIISISAAVTAIILNNVLFAIVILVGTFALTIHAVKHPPLLHIAISNRGIAINDIFYLYDTLDSFWVEENFHPQKVLIKSKKLFMTYIILPIPADLDGDAIRDELEKYLPEVQHHEPFLQKVFEYLGF